MEANTWAFTFLVPQQPPAPWRSWSKAWNVPVERSFDPHGAG